MSRVLKHPPPSFLAPQPARARAVPCSCDSPSFKQHEISVIECLRYIALRDRFWRQCRLKVSQFGLRTITMFFR